MPMTKRFAPPGLSTYDSLVALPMRLLWMILVFMGAVLAVTQLHCCGPHPVLHAIVHGNGVYNVPMMLVLVPMIQGAGPADDGICPPSMLDRRDVPLTGVLALDADRGAMPPLNGAKGASFRHMNQRLIRDLPILA